MTPTCPCPSYCDLLIYRCWGEAYCYLLLHVDHQAGLGFFWSAAWPRSIIYKSVNILWTELRSTQDPGTVQIAIYSFLPAKCFPGPFSVFKQNNYFLLLFFLLKIPNFPMEISLHSELSDQFWSSKPLHTSARAWYVILLYLDQ